jgi:hypothetical protein
MALKEGAMASAGAADVGLIIALGRGNATDNPLARLRTSTQSTTAMRNYRTSADGLADQQVRPFAAFQDRRRERARSARKQSLAEGVGCANSGRTGAVRALRAYGLGRKGLSAKDTSMPFQTGSAANRL